MARYGCRLALILLFAFASISLSGCITFLTDIKVRGDGSGTMVQTMTFNPEQMKASAESIASQMGATMSEPKEDSKKEPPKAQDNGPFKESELKGKAADLGPGVTFVSAEKIETSTAVGVRVTYAFKDINNLSVNPRPAAAMGTAGAGASSEDALKFRFRRKLNGNAEVTVVIARPKPDDKKDQLPAPPPSSPEESAQQLEMAKQMFKGLHMGLAVDVDGKIIKTNSAYVEGSRVTLMDLDFGELLSDEAGFKRFNQKMEDAQGDDMKAMDALKGIRGLKITAAPEISIEFAPK